MGVHPTNIDKFIGFDPKDWLVVSIPLKNRKVNWDDCSQYMENQSHVPVTTNININFNISQQKKPAKKTH